MKLIKFFIPTVVFLHLVLFLSTQFIAWPEMIFWPHLVLKGWLPYKDIGIAHSPILVFLLTGFYKLFGIGIIQQKAVSWLIPIITDLVLYLIVKKKYSTKVARYSLIFFVLAQIYFEGNGIWFDHLLALFALVTYYFLSTKKYLLAGIFLVLSYLVKQTAFWFFIPVAYSFLTSVQKRNMFFRMFIGSIVVVTVFLTLIQLFGISEDYISWTFRFGVGTLPKLAGKVPTTIQTAIVILPYTIFVPTIFLRRTRQMYDLFLWSIFGAFGTFPRFELFHFQPALPFLAIIFGLYFKDLTFNKGVGKWTYVMLIIPLLMGANILRKVNMPDRFYSANDQKIIAMTKDLVRPNSLIFVTNYWDNLYAFTDTLPAIRPFIPQLTQYINHPGVEEAIIDDFLKNRPEIVVRGQFLSDDSKVFRFEKTNNFIDNNYRVIQTAEKIDILIEK